MLKLATRLFDVFRRVAIANCSVNKVEAHDRRPPGRAGASGAALVACQAGQQMSTHFGPPCRSFLRP